MEEPVESAEVDECAERCEALHLALHYVTDLDRLEERVLVLLDLPLEILTP